MPPEIEESGGAEFEFRQNGDSPVLVGHAAVFNRLSEELGPSWDRFKEQVAPGAFAQSLEENDVRALAYHDHRKILGRQSAGTLRLQEDDVGLRVEIDLPDTSVGRDLAVLVKRRDIREMSFGFRAQVQEWDDSGDMPIRTLKKVDLREVSAVLFPAYRDTSIALRFLDEWRNDNVRTIAPNRRTIICLALGGYCGS